MWLSIMGMYEYDPTIFDGLEIPSYTDEDNNIHTVNRDNLINSILLQCAELEVIYPDLNTMKLAIGVWAAAEIDAWNKLYASQIINYNPIWNVDANILETNTGTENRDIDRNASGSDNRTINLSDKHSVQGYNSNTWAEADKDDHTGTDNTALSNTEAINDDVTRNTTRTERRTGNIGVTATQDLIKKEREVAAFSIINYITLSFKKRFCLLVY